MTQVDRVHPLRKWRNSAGKTLQQCANTVGTTRQTWAEWENGRRIPNRTFMKRVLALTGGTVSADDFYQQDSEAA